ncbi:MAG TPA: IclR family transcriptional regulator [Roseiflexaceae bacterium]|nr:IclR family transcriptional regulator [Roseiflexaceae bacterium]
MKDRSSVDRALAVLQYLARHPGEHGVRAIGAALGLSPSTAHRLLESLARAGFVAQSCETSRYRIGPQAVQLGLAALGSFDVTAAAPPHLQALVAETGESSFLAVLDEGEVVYLAKAEGSRAIRTTATLGSRRPAHCTALGKSFLATMPPDEARALLERRGMPAFTPNTITDLGRLWEELAAVRRRGYAVDREEIEEGLMCIGAPVRDYSGRTVAAISLAGPVERILPHEERYGRRVLQAAAEISLALGYTPPA